jgi:hypothetical protein
MTAPEVSSATVQDVPLPATSASSGPAKPVEAPANKPLKAPAKAPPKSDIPLGI